MYTSLVLSAALLVPAHATGQGSGTSGTGQTRSSQAGTQGTGTADQSGAHHEGQATKAGTADGTWSIMAIEKDGRQIPMGGMVTIRNNVLTFGQSGSPRQQRFGAGNFGQNRFGNAGQNQPGAHQNQPGQHQQGGNQNQQAQHQQGGNPNQNQQTQHQPGANQAPNQQAPHQPNANQHVQGAGQHAVHPGQGAGNFAMHQGLWGQSWRLEFGPNNRLSASATSGQGTEEHNKQGASGAKEETQKESGQSGNAQQGAHSGVYILSHNFLCIAFGESESPMYGAPNQKQGAAEPGASGKDGTQAGQNTKAASGQATEKQATGAGQTTAHSGQEGYGTNGLVVILRRQAQGLGQPGFNQQGFGQGLGQQRFAQPTPKENKQ